MLFQLDTADSVAAVIIGKCHFLTEYGRCNSGKSISAIPTAAVPHTTVVAAAAAAAAMLLHTACSSVLHLSSVAAVDASPVRLRAIAAAPAAPCKAAGGSAASAAVCWTAEEGATDP